MTDFLYSKYAVKERENMTDIGNKEVQLSASLIHFYQIFNRTVNCGTIKIENSKLLAVDETIAEDSERLVGFF